MTIAAAQASKFYEQVVAEARVFTFLVDGSFLVFPIDGHEVVPFWSSRTRLTSIQRNHPKYRAYTADEIPLETFLHETLDQLADQDIRVGVNWSGKRLVATMSRSLTFAAILTTGLASTAAERRMAGIRYVLPTLAVHCIDVHGYLPPGEFLGRAVRALGTRRRRSRCLAGDGPAGGRALLSSRCSNGDARYDLFHGRLLANGGPFVEQTGP